MAIDAAGRLQAAFKNTRRDRLPDRALSVAADVHGGDQRAQTSLSPPDASAPGAQIFRRRTKRPPATSVYLVTGGLCAITSISIKRPGEMNALPHFSSNSADGLAARMSSSFLPSLIIAFTRPLTVTSMSR